MKLVKTIGAWEIYENAPDPRYPDDTVFNCVYDDECYDVSWSLRQAVQYCEAHPKELVLDPDLESLDLDFDDEGGET